MKFTSYADELQWVGTELAIYISVNEHKLKSY